MPFNLQNFRADMNKTGFAQPNHYEIQMVGMPAGINFSDKQKEIFNGLPLKVYSTQLPGVILDTLERRYHGPIRLIPTGFVYQQLPVMIYENADYGVRDAFDTWIYGLTERDGWFTKYYDDIIVPQMYLKLYSRTGEVDANGNLKPIKTYVFNEVYPISVSATQLDWAANNSIMGINIELQYHSWGVVDGDITSTRPPLRNIKTLNSTNTPNIPGILSTNELLSGGK